MYRIYTYIYICIYIYHSSIPTNCRTTLLTSAPRDVQFAALAEPRVAPAHHSLQRAPQRQNCAVVGALLDAEGPTLTPRRAIERQVEPTDTIRLDVDLHRRPQPVCQLAHASQLLVVHATLRPRHHKRGMPLIRLHEHRPDHFRLTLCFYIVLYVA